MERRNKRFKKSHPPPSATVESAVSNEKPEDTWQILNELREREADLDRQIEELERQGAHVDLKPQMEALHAYNRAKDIAQTVLGHLAEIKQYTLLEMHEQFDLPTD